MLFYCWPSIVAYILCYLTEALINYFTKGVVPQIDEYEYYKVYIRREIAPTR